jgi:hypothetical protein
MKRDSSAGPRTDAVHRLSRWWALPNCSQSQGQSNDFDRPSVLYGLFRLVSSYLSDLGRHGSDLGVGGQQPSHRCLLRWSERSRGGFDGELGMFCQLDCGGDLILVWSFEGQGQSGNRRSPWIAICNHLSICDGTVASTDPADPCIAWVGWLTRLVIDRWWYECLRATKRGRVKSEWTWNTRLRKARRRTSIRLQEASSPSHLHQL